jgi:hypothetical protein
MLSMFVITKGGGSERSDSTWELAFDLGSSSPTPPPCAVAVSPLAPVWLFYNMSDQTVCLSYVLRSLCARLTERFALLSRYY